MEKDAISAGVSKIGGLFSTADVRILICYILSSFDTPIPGQLMAEVLHSEGIANAFEVGDSLAHLLDSGHIKEIDGKNLYIITDAGRNVADTLSTSLAIIVKQRAYAAILKMMVKYRNAKETAYEITEEDGRTFITCSALDGGKPFMSIKLLLGDRDQAIFVKEKFLENASEIFSKIYEIIARKN